MQIDRLRLIGFKSFVDATELTVGPGLTGIVGPNGCGKSNLVEALRWVMGETSARRLRGGEMDDVIFAGSAERPARNIAQVALLLDNSARDAPFVFNDHPEIEIVRRIERGGGSIYRANGREVRARDVQLLFADAASGAHSGAMVSQGRVGTLIEAKPAERRLLLEEAAGTTGLHARRHETELRLKAAEDNLLRLDDVIATIEAQLQTLKKQARQAQRYRRLGEHIRRTEALLFHARWRIAEAEVERYSAELRAVERAVAEATEQNLFERRARTAAEAALPPLRIAEAGATAERQRLIHARSALEQELQRVLAGRSECEQRLGQLSADLKREGEHIAEAEGNLTRLSEERVAIALADGSDGPMREMAADYAREASTRLAEAEAVLQRATESAAAIEARRAAHERRRIELADRGLRLEARHQEAERQREELAAAALPVEVVIAATAALAAAEERVEACRAAVAASEQEVARCLAAEQAAIEAARPVEARLTRLEAEAEALAALAAPAPDRRRRPAAYRSVARRRGLRGGGWSCIRRRALGPRERWRGFGCGQLLGGSRADREHAAIAEWRACFGRVDDRSAGSRPQSGASRLGRERRGGPSAAAEPRPGTTPRRPSRADVAMGRVYARCTQPLGCRRAFAVQESARRARRRSLRRQGGRSDS